MPIKNQVQLITYPDSFGGDLKTLNSILLEYFPGVFKGGIHILPPYPSSGDRGFAPLTYLEIEPKFGNWDDIKKLTENFDILLDLMVNHISRHSMYFSDFLENGKKSPYADLFITLDKVWPEGNPDADDLAKIFLRRAEPFSTYTIKASGEEVKIWTTFGKQDPSEQIDLDINAPATKRLLTDFLNNFSKQNIKMIRLDAIGFVVKKPGTSCFFVEPEIYDFLKWISETANALGIELLPEVHAHHSIQSKLAEKGYWSYDFILPYLVLETLINKNNQKLLVHLRTCPHKQFTMLDCHDGIPVMPDLNEIVETGDARKIVDICLKRGANLSKIFSEEHKYDDGFDVHQIRCSYYSVLNCNDDAYLAARAIQFFAPGIPQVYYVGLLAGENDNETVKKQGDGRAINRYNYTVNEIKHEVQKPVVKRLIKLIKFRNEYEAFNGDFKVENSDETHFQLIWKKEDWECRLSVDLNNFKTSIRYFAIDGNERQMLI